jgi:transposase
VEHAFRELRSELDIGLVFVRAEDHVRGHIVVCLMALVLETALKRLLKALCTSQSYWEVLVDLEQLHAVRFEARGKA